MKNRLGKNDQDRKKIKSEMDEINTHIGVFEDKIRYKKKRIAGLEQERNITRKKMKNLMSEYGVSVDFIADAFIPNPYLAVAKGMTDYMNAPSIKDIKNHMDKVDRLEKTIKNTEDEIFHIGTKIRQSVDIRDDLVRKWRYLKNK
ncbi:MAG: hypothetical protein OEY94_06335 [Alphaproteobacteria bacterium]|nr:hypothetical protein [Alphaproteobacteria bacterium]